jgi:hypothetical protein
MTDGNDGAKQRTLTLVRFALQANAIAAFGD